MDQHEMVKALFTLLRMLQHEPDGLTTPEIAEQLGITRQTALKYIQHLDGAGLPITEDRNRYVLDNTYRLPDYLSPADGELLALIVRRFELSGFGAQSETRHLLDQLAQRIPGVLGQFPVGSQDFESGEGVFQRLVEAKNKRQWVRLIYRAPNAGSTTEWLVKPYSFRLPLWSDGLYLVCDGQIANRPEQRLTLKLNRIQSAEILREYFQSPPLNELHAQMQSAWAVWQAPGPTHHIVLRFPARLYDRLIESLWHLSQDIRQEGGMVIWEAEIAEPLEMIPWIRGWGPDVEVLEPGSLRARIARDHQRALHQYAELAARPITDLGLLWAKYDRATRETHSLLAHLLDVSASAIALWSSLPPALRAGVSALLGWAEEDCMRLCGFLAGIHDVGKAAPAFQRKAGGMQSVLEQDGWVFKGPFPEPYDHGAASADMLHKVLPGLIPGLSTMDANVLAVAVGGHHGQPPQAQRLSLYPFGKDARWNEAPRQLIERVYAALGELPPWPQLDEQSLNLFGMFLAGLTTVADWIGSNEAYFPYQPMPEDDRAYLDAAFENAQAALEGLGWQRWMDGGDPPSFTMVFPSYTPHPVQAAVLKAFESRRDAAVIIVEAPTGIGKTELALILAETMVRERQLAGIYIAMPTQATSNQIYHRTAKFLQAARPHQRINFLLAHGQAEFNTDFQQAVSSSGRDGAGVVAEEWFTSSRKRRLLSPYAVGTVDQALMGVLQVRHFFVRLFALAAKAIVFDEVHAYDTYMSRLFGRLLEWLTALGSPIILLSATLPERVRRDVAACVLPGSQNALPALPYPRVTFLYRDRLPEVIALPRPESRTLYLDHIGRTAAELTDYLTERMADGGCVAAMCNTVKEAQGLYRALQETMPGVDLLLFHAQYPPAWREGIERDVVQRFGKESLPEERGTAVLVATQVVEQSLDLDFDLMVSAYAPIDLLIQRAGRLHRHERPRPPRLSSPVLALREPDSSEEAPDFGADEWVYARYLLLRTWWLLRERPALTLPGETDALIEAVYPAQNSVLLPEDAPDWLKRDLADSFRELERSDRIDSYKATLHDIPPPTDDQLWGNLRSHSDDEEASPQPATRLPDRSVRIMCLFDRNGVWSLDPDVNIPCPLDRKPTSEERQQIGRYLLTVRNITAVTALTDIGLVEYWSRIPLLRDVRVLLLDAEGMVRLSDKTVLRLSKEFGLEINPKEVS